MSLRDLGVFSPLTADHPMVTGEPTFCWLCTTPLVAGVRIALRPYQTAEEAGSYSVEARAVCATCHLRGTEVGTPAGRRIVDTILDGDVLSAVLTTDGRRWRDEEVTP